MAKRLKTTIISNLASLLVISGILIGIVMLIMIQKNLLKTKISQAHFFILTVKQMLYKDQLLKGQLIDWLNSSFEDTQIEALYLTAANRKPLSIDLNGNFDMKTLKSLNTEATSQKHAVSRLSGSAMEFLMRRKLKFYYAEPFFERAGERVTVALSIGLEGVYRDIAHIQKIALVYLVINTFALVVIGYFRLSIVTVKPLKYLLMRADEYQGEKGSEELFADGPGDSDFNRLSKTLNRMLRQISNDRQKLQLTVERLKDVNRDLQGTQNEMVRAEKLVSIGRLSAGIAHEIGNPIGIISGYLELLKNEKLPFEERHDYLVRSEEEIQRIHLIVRQLLDLARPSPESYESVSTHHLIMELAEVFNLQPVTKKINFNLSLEAESDQVLADPSKLRQVFMNLILNAADAIGSNHPDMNGNIDIKTKVILTPGGDKEKATTMLMVEIIDDGEGIVEGQLSNIFDPFYTTKAPGKGTGLGLAVSYMIIEGMGGAINAHRREAQKGAILTLFLPLLTEDEG